jgi:hypothetical protein
MKGMVIEKKGTAPLGDSERKYSSLSFFLIPDLPGFSSRDSPGRVASLVGYGSGEPI